MWLLCDFCVQRRSWCGVVGLPQAPIGRSGSSTGRANRIRCHYCVGANDDGEAASDSSTRLRRMSSVGRQLLPTRCNRRHFGLVGRTIEDLLVDATQVTVDMVSDATSRSFVVRPGLRLLAPSISRGIGKIESKRTIRRVGIYFVYKQTSVSSMSKRSVIS